jgi:hypothetical protein
MIGNLPPATGFPCSSIGFGVCMSPFSMIQKIDQKRRKPHIAAFHLVHLSAC